MSHGAIHPAGPTAVLVVPATTLNGASRPTALEPVLGRSPVHRHLHHLGALGVPQVVILLDPALDGPATAAAWQECRASLPHGMPQVTVVQAREELRWPDLVPSTECLLIRADSICDARCYPLLLAEPGPRALVDSTPGKEGRRGSSSAAPGAALGMLRTSAATLEAMSPPTNLTDILPLLDGTGDFPSGPRTTIDIRTLPEYIPELRRQLPLSWTRIQGEEDQRRAARQLLDAAQKGILDFPARFLHPLPENTLVRLLAGTPVTPNAVTILTGILGFGATYLFATGGIGIALAIALAVNVLDGVDGKLARVRLQASRFGDRLDHLLDVTFEFSWYLAIGWGLAADSPGGRSLYAGLGLIAVMILSRALSGVYRAQSGRQIHDHRAFDRGFRLVAGRRNIYVLVLVAGWLADRFEGALWLSLWWGLATASVYLVRVGMAWAARRANRVI